MSSVILLSILLMSFEPTEYNAGAAMSDNESTITFNVKGLKSTEGQVLVTLFNSETSFLNEAFRVETATITLAQDLKITFSGVPYGEYAVSVIHDKNNNNKLDRGWFGIPKEPYAFSNNAKGHRGPASYQDAKFVVSQTQTNHEIRIGSYSGDSPGRANSE